MKLQPPQQKVTPNPEVIDAKYSTDGQYMGKDVAPFPLKKILEPSSHSQALPGESLYQRVINLTKSLAHLIWHHETLSNRIRIIEESRLKPQKRLPFLNANLEKISRKFNGDEATKLFDFSDGCCFGITSNYILFETLDEQERFEEILSTLSQDPEMGWVFWGQYYSNLADAIATAQDMLRKKPKTSDPDTLLLIQLRPFCESLLLFQSPEDTTSGSLIPFQYADAAAQLVASESLEDDAILQSTPYYTAGLKPGGVKRLLLNIRATVGEQQPERLFHIASGGHIIALKVSNQGYVIIDQNIDNYKKFFPIGDENKLVSFLADRIQGISSGIRLPCYSNSIFLIKEFYLKSILSSTPPENGRLKEILKEIQDAHQCSVNEQNFDGYSQLHLAMWTNNVEDVKRLLSKRDLAPNSVRGESSVTGCQDMATALHLACEKGSTEAARLMLKDDRCSPALLSAENKTPLWFASKGGHASIVKALLEVTPESLNIPDNIGQSPLFVAAFLNHLDIVKQLTEHPDLKINQKRADGATALHTASYAGNAQIVEQLLIRKDIEIDSRTNESETPLKMAAMNGHSNCVAVLLDHGAHVDEVCIQAAEAAGHYQLALQLREKLISREDRLF